MATGESTETLETWLNKVTDPSNTSERWDCIQGFYEQVNREPEGPLIATRLLAHKIQSPQENEALQALTLLEACMNYCGKRFHSEAAKFRFLNELIKVLSPKYLGAYSPAAVKERVTEVLYSWTKWLKDEPKIQEAYRMLKKQGVIKKDPKLPDTIVMPPPTQRPEGSLFDDEDKSKLLARLLKSNKPEDLQTANRLIKNTIKEEQEKTERVSRRISTLEEVERNTAQLQELLERHRNSGGPPTPPTQDMKTAYERCDKLRPNLFRLASDTVDDDEALALILQANDKLTSVVNLYKETAAKQEVTCNGGAGPSANTASPADAPANHSVPEDTSSLLLFDDDMVSLGAASPTPSPVTPSKSYFEELIELEDIVRTPERLAEDTEFQQRPNGTGPILIARGCEVDSISQNGFLTSSVSAVQSRPALSNLQNLTTVKSQSPSKNVPPQLDKSLTDIVVSLESVKPSRLEPITVYDRWGVHVCLHFCQDSPPSRPDVAVVIVSTVNTSALSISDVQFQVAVPKSMTVKLQPSTAKDLPPYNPLQPPASISQILLLANPQRTPVRLRYRLTLKHGDEKISELGEIDHFPEWHSWTTS